MWLARLHHHQQGHANTSLRGLRHLAGLRHCSTTSTPPSPPPAEGDVEPSGESSGSSGGGVGAAEDDTVRRSDKWMWLDAYSKHKARSVAEEADENRKYGTLGKTTHFLRIPYKKNRSNKHTYETDPWLFIKGLFPKTVHQINQEMHLRRSQPIEGVSSVEVQHSDVQRLQRDKFAKELIGFREVFEKPITDAFKVVDATLEEQHKKKRAAERRKLKKKRANRPAYERRVMTMQRDKNYWERYSQAMRIGHFAELPPTEEYMELMEWETLKHEIAEPTYDLDAIKNDYGHWGDWSMGQYVASFVEDDDIEAMRPENLMPVELQDQVYRVIKELEYAYAPIAQKIANHVRWQNDIVKDQRTKYLKSINKEVPPDVWESDNPDHVTEFDDIKDPDKVSLEEIQYRLGKAYQNWSKRLFDPEVEKRVSHYVRHLAGAHKYQSHTMGTANRLEQFVEQPLSDQTIFLTEADMARVIKGQLVEAGLAKIVVKRDPNLPRDYRKDAHQMTHQLLQPQPQDIALSRLADPAGAFGKGRNEQLAITGAGYNTTASAATSSATTSATTSAAAGTSTSTHPTPAAAAASGAGAGAAIADAQNALLAKLTGSEAVPKSNVDPPDAAELDSDDGVLKYGERPIPAQRERSPILTDDFNAYLEFVPTYEDRGTFLMKRKERSKVKVSAETEQQKFEREIRLLDERNRNMQRLPRHKMDKYRVLLKHMKDTFQVDTQRLQSEIEEQEETLDIMMQYDKWRRLWPHSEIGTDDVKGEKLRDMMKSDRWYPDNHLFYKNNVQFFTRTIPFQEIHRSALFRLRKVVMRVYVAPLELPHVVRQRLKEILGPRYNMASKVVTLTGSDRHTQRDNKSYLKLLFREILHEAWLADPNYISMRESAPAPIPKFTPSESAAAESTKPFVFRLFANPLHSRQFEGKQVARIQEDLKRLKAVPTQLK